MAQKNIHSIILREKNSSNKTQASILFCKKSVSVYIVHVYTGGERNMENVFPFPVGYGL